MSGSKNISPTPKGTQKKDFELVNVVDPDGPAAAVDSEKELPKSAAKASLGQLFCTADSLDWCLMIVGSMGGVGTGLCMPAFNVLFGEMLDELNTDPNGLAKGIAGLAITFIYLACINLVCGFLQVYCWSYTGERQTQKLRERYVKAVLSQEVGWYDETGAGELSTRVADLSGKVQDGIGRKLGDFCQYLGQLVGAFAAAFYLSWELTLVLMAGVPLIGLAGTFMITSVSEAKNASFETYAAAGGVASETFNGIRTVTALNNQPAIIAKYRVLLQRAMEVGILKGRNLGLGHGGLFGAAFLLYALGFWYGGVLVADDIDSGCSSSCVTGGAIMSTFFCVIMGSMALGSLAPPMTALVEAQCAALPMVELIARKPLIDSFSEEGSKPSAPSAGRLELRDVKFAYPTRPDFFVCNGYNLTVEPGQTVALVGHSGSGKSTIMNLLLRFYDPQEGEVLLDGAPLKALNIQWLRSQYGYVGQEPVLFHGTIADNILDSIADINAEYKSVPVAQLAPELRRRMEDAAKMASAHDFIAAFPAGYDTEVGSNGTQLSGGQKQRIAIARALVRKPAVLLLDEATSALDAASERDVQRALDTLHTTRAQTTIVIAHRLSTIRNADKIAVVSGGRIAELGTHDELVGREGGIYADLIRLQMSGHDVASPEKDKMRARGESDFSDRARTRTESGGAGKGGVDALTNEEDRGEEQAEAAVVKAEGEPVVELSAEKKAELKGRIWSYVLQHRAWVVAAVLGAATFGAVFPVWGLLLSVSQEMFFLSDTDEMRRRGEELALLYIALSATCLVSCLGQYWGTAQVGERVMLQLRSEMFESVVRREISYFDRPENSVGALTTRLSEDARLMQRSAAESLAKLMQAVFTLLIGLVLGMLASWQIALVVLATFPLNIVASGIQMAAMSGGLYDKDDGSGGEGAVIGTAFTNFRTVSAFSLQNKVSGIYNQITAKKSSERCNGARIAGIGFGASGFLLFLSYALLFWFGSTLIEDGEVTFQEMMQAIMCLMLGTMGLGQALNDLADQNAGLQAAYRVFMAIDEAASCSIDGLSRKGATLEGVKGRIELRNVAFAYPSRPDVTVCKGYSLVIEPGQVVALVGPSGSGKSTIMNLLLRFYDPQEGEVLLDGAEVRGLSVRWLRDQIGYVGQEPTLFSGSVAENIAKGRRQGSADGPAVTVAPRDLESAGVGGVDADIVDATTVSNAHGFISAFPKGYDTDVGEGSVMVSGGQKQRIAIARALVRKPAVLLLDEATSALDTESEQLIQAAIDKLQETRAQTTIIIAHRLSTIKNADKIAVLDAGQVVEMGTHDELVGKEGGLYAKLWARQTGEK